MSCIVTLVFARAVSAIVTFPQISVFGLQGWRRPEAGSKEWNEVFDCVLDVAGIAAPASERLDAASISHGVEHRAQHEVEPPFNVGSGDLRKSSFKCVEKGA